MKDAQCTQHDPKRGPEVIEQLVFIDQKIAGQLPLQ